MLIADLQQSPNQKSFVEETIVDVADTVEDENDNKTHRIVSIATPFLLGIITVATAWSGFQATKWGGNMSNSYAAASAVRSSSVQTSLTANQETLLDVQLFIEWINAVNEDDTRRAEFYFDRMREEVKPAMEAWLATDPRNNPDAPPSPFGMPEYVQAKRLEAVELEEEAEALSQQALDSNQTGDNYVLTTVILASGLFFAGIAPLRFRDPKIELALLVMALATFAYGTYLLVSYPVLT